MIMRSQWNSVPYIVTIIFMMAFITIFGTMNDHQADAVQFSQSPSSYLLYSFQGTSAPSITLTMTLHIPNAAQNPGVDISEPALVQSYFVKPTVLIKSTEQLVTWTDITDSDSTVIAYQGTVKLVYSSYLNVVLDFNPLFLTGFDLQVKEGADIASQLTTFDFSFGAAPLRSPYQGTYFTPSYHLELQNNIVQLYFPNLPHFDTNELCIGMQFDTSFLPSFDVAKLVDERIPQDVTPTLPFKSTDSLQAVICFEPDGTTATATLGSIGFTLSGIPANLGSIQFFEIPSRFVVPPFVLDQFFSVGGIALYVKESSLTSFQLINISEAAQLFSSQQSANTSPWFQWSFFYKQSSNSQYRDALTFLPEFYYFGESQIHFCRPADADLQNVQSIPVYNGIFEVSPTAQAFQSQTSMIINCFGTVSPYYRHRNGIDESSTWQKNSETPFMIQSPSDYRVHSSLFDFDKSTSLPAVSSLPQIIYTTEDYPLSITNSLLIAQHKLVLAVNGYTFATGIVFRIPNVFSVVKARGDQTPVTDANQYVAITYYESSAQPIYFAGQTDTQRAIVPPTLKTDSVVTCATKTATDGSDTTIYTCNPPATNMIDLTYTMFLSRVVDFQDISDYTQKQPSFSVFKYHPSSDYTNPAGPLKVFEVPMTIKMTDPILVSVPSETGTTLQLTQQSTSAVPTSSTSALSLPTSELSIQFGAALQGSSCTAQASYYVVDGATPPLITQQTTETVTAAAISTSIPAADLAKLTSKSVIVMMVHYINNEDSTSPIATYFLTQPFTVQSSCDGEDVCKNDGVCGLDGACHCADPWKGADCATCPLQCENGGTANAACTECVCADPWKGADCATCPLQCANGGITNTACTECVCADPWKGADCATCPLQCANGGITNTACTECTCVGSWGGNFCYTCPLQCQNGGSHNAECTKCDCFAGFTGDSCESVTSDKAGDVNNAMAVNFTFALFMVVMYSLSLCFH